MWRFRPFWRDRMNRKNIADRFGPRLSNFLSCGIVVFIKIDDFPHFSILCLLFSQYCLKSKSPLPFEKSIPGLPRLEPHRKVNAWTLYKFSQSTKNGQLVFKPWLFAEIWVSKIPGFIHGFPMIFHGFPTHGGPWGPMGSHGVPTSAQTRPARRRKRPPCEEKPLCEEKPVWRGTLCEEPY